MILDAKKLWNDNVKKKGSWLYDKTLFLSLLGQSLLDTLLSLCVKAIQIVEFSNGGYKTREIFAEESSYSKKIIEFLELVLRGGVKHDIGHHF